ncbi:hypothetical protein A3K86_06635 [Photobacterium jeanii]|uniref:Uncharacterized protein n=1 Tax=Photobacterium jeanii TaxID=858640 RepID=A0A178KMF0_9GAMM|nr:hypothetical protein [Photobacterium jeanii]OAN18558.1 hypothetical protein A3K86_06635 [Photobacterium jeanii]PST91760.1 hypothetical protein C9I91_00835 [Photobacterium jeanii]
MNRVGVYQVVGRWILVAVALFSSAMTYAYSYAAAGKEPVIDGREAILLALEKQDFNAVQQAVGDLKDEFAYLKKEHNVDLQTPMAAAVANQDAAQVEAIMDRAVVEEIVRRLDGASKNLADYQVAKVLVVKSKLFLDLITPKLDDSHRQQAEQAIQGTLQAIGNPGVFGVGQAPADPEAFKQQQQLLIDAISTLHP